MKLGEELDGEKGDHSFLLQIWITFKSYEIENWPRKMVLSTIHLYCVCSLILISVCCSCSIGRYTRDLPRSTVDSLIESAFSVWARASSLTFVRSNTRSADIMVEFASYGGFVFSSTRCSHGI